MSDYPTIRPRLLLDFANSKKLDRRITFRRSSTGTYVGADGLIKTAGIDEPRFDHDPITGVCKGLLVEESRTNLILNSGDWESFATTQQNITALADKVTAPDGLTTAKKLQSTSTSFASSYQTVSLVAGVQYTLSVYVKAGTHTSAQLRLRDSDFFATATFNFSIGTSSGGIIQGLPNGWFRCSVTGTANTTTGLGRAYFEFQSPVTASSTLYFFGAQLEAGAFPTSYIPTVASTVTRSADSANITGTNFSSWYNQSEGTLVHVGNFIGDVFTLTYARLNSLIVRFGNSNLNSFTNQWTIGANRSSGPSLPPALDSIVYNGSNVQNLISYYELFNVPVGSKMKISSYIDTVRGSVGHCLNGLPVERISIVNTPPWNNLSLTTAYDGSVRCGTISSFAYWPKRLPDAQLRALTRR